MHRLIRLLPAGILAMMTRAAVADVLIDNFEGRSSPAPWAFSNGPEFPGAKGSLALGAGYSGQGAQLAYDLSSGGNYTAAYLALPTPLAAAAISLWLRTPSNVLVVLRVTDSTGQVFQYSLNRPAEATDTSAWYQQVVALDSPTSWYSGANDGVLHNPISGIGVLATNGVDSRPVGTVDFDEVYALGSATFTLSASLPLIPAPPGNSSLLAQMGVNIHFVSDDGALDAAHAAGFSWVRADLTWSSVESIPKVYNWGAYDTLVSALQSRGMKALLILDYGNPLYTGTAAAPPTTPDSIAAFGSFARAAAGHFAGTGTRFEVWNEPNGGSWPPAANPAQYAALLAVATSSVHQGDPNALVATGGLSGFDFNFVRGFLGHGGADGADAIGVHPYDVPNPMGELTDYYAQLKYTVAHNLDNPPPIWGTEWGFTSVDYSPAGTQNGHDPGARRRQAAMVAKEMLSSCAVGFPLYVYYDLRDDGTDAANREDNFGLLANDDTDKPAMAAVRRLAAIAGSRKFSGFIHTAPSSLVAMRFDGADDYVVALWSFAPNSSVAVSVVGNAAATDLFGAPLPLQDGTLTVSDAGGPVYITFARGAWLANFSARALVKGGQDQLIAGFVTTGPASKSLLIRGDGPALGGFGVTGFLPDPQLTLQDSAGVTLASAGAWSAPLAPIFSSVGAFGLAAGSQDAALLESLPPGAHTARVASQTANSGVALAEIYDADSGAPANRLINLSARALVATGPDVLIGGFVVGGAGFETLLIRAAGPALTGFGVGAILANPALTLLDSNGAAIAANSGWGNPITPGDGAVSSGPTKTTIQPATAEIFAQEGAFGFPSGSADSAFLATLPPGAYTVQVADAHGGTGVALLEIYEVR
ncbi:MAG TPA: hypothetical protein VN775_03455 [Opitutaceae bacterium]|nr:hypothetical protein [Opitutaceae bacterium]